MTLRLPHPWVTDPEVQQNFEAVTSRFGEGTGYLQTKTGANGLAVGAFSVYRAATQSATSGDVVMFASETFDVSGWYDTSTGRYTPQVAGYYRFGWRVGSAVALAADTYWVAVLRKNDAQVGAGMTGFQRGTSSYVNSGGTKIVQANGSSDYFDVVLFHGVGAATDIASGAVITFFDGEFIGRS